MCVCLTLTWTSTISVQQWSILTLTMIRTWCIDTYVIATAIDQQTFIDIWKIVIHCNKIMFYFNIYHQWLTCLKELGLLDSIYCLMDERDISNKYTFFILSVLKYPLFSWNNSLAQTAQRLKMEYILSVISCVWIAFQELCDPKGYK